MTRFEVGERYRIGGIAVEIVGRSARYVTYRNVQHVEKEWFLAGHYEVDSSEKYEN